MFLLTIIRRNDMTRHPITRQRLVVLTPAMNRVSVDRDLPFGSEASEELRFDIYRPALATQSLLPAVIFVMGYSETHALDASGCHFKDWAAYVDWARLVASSGAMAITYTNEDPVRDTVALIEHIENNAESLGVDRARLGLWSCSGNTPTALAVLQRHEAVKCAALCYGYLLDAPRHDEVARAAAQFGFVDATAGMRIGDLANVPLLVVRAGRDKLPGLNISLDRFVDHALRANLPISVVNHASGVHAFDVAEATEEARGVVHQIRQFLALRLRA
jgi:dienelactone hydrolase